MPEYIVGTSLQKRLGEESIPDRSGKKYEFKESFTSANPHRRHGGRMGTL